MIWLQIAKITLLIRLFFSTRVVDLKNKTENSIGHLLTSLKIPAIALPTLAIIAYFSGWQYVNEYLSNFNINRSSYAFSDYTTFVHSFSVISNIFNLIPEYKFNTLFWISPFVLLILGPKIISFLPKNFSQKIILHVWSWTLLFTMLFFLSQQAGSYDAAQIKNKKWRPISLIIFSKSFKESLVITKSENYAKARINELNQAASNDALALIWRNSNETILMQASDSGSNKGEPIKILRIDNSHITAIETDP